MSKSSLHQKPVSMKQINPEQQTPSLTSIKKPPPQVEKIGIKSTSSTQQDEEEKIYKALSACYDQYLEGNKVLMNKIVNEMSNRHKEKEHIKMWLRASTKKLIDLFKNKQDVNYLVEVVLYQMPWFEAGNEYEIGQQEQEQKKQQQSEMNQQLTHQQHQIGSNTSLFSSCSSARRIPHPQPQLTILKPSPHFELFSELSKFIMTLLSFSNAFAPQTIKFLISNIVPMEIKAIEKSKKSEIEIIVEGHAFENQKKLLMYIRDCLNKYVLNSISDVQELNKEDASFLQGVLKYHPNAKEKMQRFKKLLIGQAQFDDKISRCLYIENKDGQKIDISYVKSVQNLVDEQFQKIGLKQGSPNQKKMILQIIELLAKTIKIYPLYQNDLCRIIQESYPHRVQGEQYHKIYLTNILLLAIECPQLMPKILMIAIQKLNEIDSEIKLDYQEGVDNEKNSQIMAEKLDWLMLIIFEFIDYQLQDKVGQETCFGEIKKSDLSEKQKEQNEEKFFKIFLNVFSEHILITHQSKYVQFMMFYLCSLRSKFQNSFLNHLMANITKKNPLVYKSTQINSIYYMGSYLARAKYVKQDSVRKIFEYLIEHLKKYIQKFDERQKEDNYNEGLHKIHQNLYHLLQAMLYILCFRFNAVSENNDTILKKFFEIFSQACQNFNALFFISPNVLTVFKDICVAFEQTQFYELLENKGQNDKTLESTSSVLQQHAQILDTYFPFDPYCLQYSDKFICEIYQNWQEYSPQYQLNVANQNSQDKQLGQNNNKSKSKKNQNNSKDDINNSISNKNNTSINNVSFQPNSHFNNSLNASFAVNQSNCGTINNGNNSNRYGFTIDKLNNINDLEYDCDNMIDDEEENIQGSLSNLLPHDYESDLEYQIQSAKNNAEKKGVLNGKRRHPISTTDNSVNNTPITNNDEDSNNQPIVLTKKNSKKNKSKHEDLDDYNFNNTSFGYKKICSPSVKEIQY